MRLCLLLIFFFSSIFTFAQPGGGGGFHVQHFLHANGSPVLVKDSAVFKVRSFILKANEVIRETFESRQLCLPSATQWQHANGLWIQPASEYFWTNENPLQLKNHRLFLTDGITEMMIDFLNVPGENGAGRIFRIDSLRLSEGYFVFDFKSVDNASNVRSPLRSLNDRHPFLIRKANKISTNLFPGRAPGKSYLLYRIDDDLQSKDTLNASIHIGMYKSKNQGKADCALSWRLVKYYELKSMYREALQALELARYCKQDQYSDEEESYLRKIDLQQKQGDYAALILSYDQLIREAEYPLAYILEREWIRAYFLGESSTALTNLRKEVKKIPDDHMQGNWYGLSEYASLYFMLGRIEFLANEEQNAYTHWRVCMQHGFGQTSDRMYIVHFDSLIKQGNDAPELFFCRGMAYFRCSPYGGGGEREKEMLQNAVNDLSLAYDKDQLQLNYGLFYGLVLNQLNRFDEALIVANKMIEQATKDGRGYYLRYAIRHRTGDAKWGDHNDKDYVTYMELMKSWKFEKI
jgi:tetratricopeptide (TPR) repeat protein